MNQMRNYETAEPYPTLRNSLYLKHFCQGGPPAHSDRKTAWPLLQSQDQLKV